MKRNGSSKPRCEIFLCEFDNRSEFGYGLWRLNFFPVPLIEMNDSSYLHSSLSEIHLSISRGMSKIMPRWCQFSKGWMSLHIGSAYSRPSCVDHIFLLSTQVNCPCPYNLLSSTSMTMLTCATWRPVEYWRVSLRNKFLVVGWLVWSI